MSQESKSQGHAAPSQKCKALDTLYDIFGNKQRTVFRTATMLEKNGVTSYVPFSSA